MEPVDQGVEQAIYCLVQSVVDQVCLRSDTDGRVLNNENLSEKLPPFTVASKQLSDPLSSPKQSNLFVSALSRKQQTGAGKFFAKALMSQRDHQDDSSSESDSSTVESIFKHTIARTMSPKRREEVPNISFWQFITMQLESNETNDESLLLPTSSALRLARVPMRLEKLMAVGFFICMDEFLYCFTLLPLRLLISTLQICKVAPSDVIRTVLLASCFLLLSMLNITFSSIYHLIRGQNFFKLYVLFNILNIFDKLCCSFGEDILDALFANANTRLFSRFTALDLIIASVYIVVHSLVLYLQIVSLNVAINSNNSSLVTLLISNNFLELKGSAFKKYTKAQLFQIASSDIVERFHLLLYVMVILVANLSNIAWYAAWEWLVQATQLALILLSIEMVVDWIKHGCIVKFNSFPAEIYGEFCDVLFSDFGFHRSLSAVPDSTHSVSRRIGFVSMPIACVLLKGLVGSLWGPVIKLFQTPIFASLVCLITFTIVVAFKLCLHLFLLGLSAKTTLNTPRHIDSFHGVERYSLFVAPPQGNFFS